MATTYGNRPVRIRFENGDSNGLAEFFDGSESGATPLKMPVFTTTERDALSSPATGEVIFNSTESKLQYYNGTVWGNIDTDTTGVSVGLVIALGE